MSAIDYGSALLLGTLVETEEHSTKIVHEDPAEDTSLKGIVNHLISIYQHKICVSAPMEMYCLFLTAEKPTKELKTNTEIANEGTQQKEIDSMNFFHNSLYSL